MQDSARAAPHISFGYHKKKSPLKKPAAAVASVFAQQDEDDDDVEAVDTVVESLSVQALTVEETSPPPATSPPASSFSRPPSSHQPQQASLTAATASSQPGKLDTRREVGNTSTKQAKVDTRREAEKASTKQAKVDDLREAGNARAVTGDMRQALALFEEAIGLAPTSSVLFELKSQCHLSLEEYLDAVRAARRAVELAPEWNEGALTLGRGLLSLGEVRAGVKVLSELLGRDGRNEEVREELIYANEALMELRRREADFDLQLDGRAGLDKRELEVARAKRHLLARGADVTSDCWLGGSEGSSWDGDERGEEEGGDEKEGEKKEEEGMI